MQANQKQKIEEAIKVLQSLTRESVAATPLQDDPVRRFVTNYLAADPAGDISCAEAAEFYDEVARAGHLPPMRKTSFLRALPAVVLAVYGSRKSHDVRRDGRWVRGFKGVTVRLDTV